MAHRYAIAIREGTYNIRQNQPRVFSLVIFSRMDLSQVTIYLKRLALKT